MKALRICILFLLLCLLTGCSLGEETVTVYCVTGYTYVDGNGKELLHQEYKYDPKGNLIAAGENSSRPQTYTYDNRGNLLTCTEYTADGRPQYTYHFTYDRQDKLLNIRIVDAADNRLRSIDFQYDSRGNQISYKDYDADNTVTERYEMEYDDRNNCIAKISYGEKDQLRSHQRMTYDSNDRLVKHETSPGYYYTYAYDSAGNILSEERYQEDALAKRYVYTYDTQGNLLSRVREYQTLPSNTEIVCTYDDAGNKLSQTDYTGVGINWDKWTYDDHGNIITIERSQANGILQVYTYRAFTVTAAHAEKIKIAQNEMLFRGDSIIPYKDSSPTDHIAFVFPTGNHYYAFPKS